MSYYREARKDELVAFLIANGVLEEDASVLAEALFARFDILLTSDTPT